jgi:ribosomal protein S18 acetylase RimI-like enzyme
VGRRLSAGTATVALVGGVDAGCVFSEAQDDGYVYFSRLSVLPRFRNRGVARALIDHVESRARSTGAAGVRLGVRLQLEHLIARYERLGYRIAKVLTHEGYAEPTYVHMEKTLTRSVDH